MQRLRMNGHRRRTDLAVKRLIPHRESFGSAGIGVHYDRDYVVIVTNAQHGGGQIYSRLTAENAGILRDHLTAFLAEARQVRKAAPNRTEPQPPKPWKRRREQRPFQDCD